jgi:excinuclease ABC subunit B
VIFYGDLVTESMRMAMEETERRRGIQAEYNRVHDITPASVKKGIPALDYAVADLDYVQLELAAESVEPYGAAGATEQRLEQLEAEMKAAAKKLEFERAAELRNRIRALKLKDLEVRS